MPSDRKYDASDLGKGAVAGKKWGPPHVFRHCTTALLYYGATILEYVGDWVKPKKETQGGKWDGETTAPLIFS